MISHAQCIAPAIFDTIFSVFKNEGVGHEHLIKEIRQREPRLRHVSKERFDRSIEMLLQESSLFEIEAGRYKCCVI